MQKNLVFLFFCTNFIRLINLWTLPRISLKYCLFVIFFHFPGRDEPHVQGGQLRPSLRPADPPVQVQALKLGPQAAQGEEEAGRDPPAGNIMRFRLLKKFSFFPKKKHRKNIATGRFLLLDRRLFHPAQDGGERDTLCNFLHAQAVRAQAGDGGESLRVGAGRIGSKIFMIRPGLTRVKKTGQAYFI